MIEECANDCEICKLIETLREKEKDIAQLKKNNETLLEVIEDLQEEIDELETRIDELEVENE